MKDLFLSPSYLDQQTQIIVMCHALTCKMLHAFRLAMGVVFALKMIEDFL